MIWEQPKVANVTKIAVSGDFFPRKAFRLAPKLSKSARKANLHRGWVGVPLPAADFLTHLVPFWGLRLEFYGNRDSVENPRS
jgi:hypothetical protein